MNGTDEADSPVPVYYIDGHRKALYEDHLIPRGLVSTDQRARRFSLSCPQTHQMELERQGMDRWQRLQIFFQLPGRICWGRDRVEVELKRFIDRALNRDLEGLCAKVIQEEPGLPNGRRLLFKVQGLSLSSLDAQEQLVA